MPTTTSPALTAEFLRSKFEAGLPYDEYVRTGAPDKQQAWGKVYEAAKLSSSQAALVGSFTRKMPVLVSSGVWCGDCVQQLPLLERIAEASPKGKDGKKLVEVRYVDRDAHKDFAELIRICGGMRVPVAVFMAEDHEPVSVFGDRTLTRYRAIAARQIGASCAVPGAPIDTDEMKGTLQDWLDEVERVHLLLRLSARLRETHKD